MQGLRIPGYVKHTSLYRDEPQQAWIGPYALAALLGASATPTATAPRIRAVNLHQLDIPMLTAAEYDQLDQAAMLLTELAEQDPHRKRRPSTGCGTHSPPASPTPRCTCA